MTCLRSHSNRQSRDLNGDSLGWELSVPSGN